ncbi:hypothetical protein [Nostoc sp. UHCC 0252]|uniref:hypothetical protein n=1 Tax=Nostoc sp. UHCC 0252 TaxID=3110241 RepID=UPI002B1F50D4|nr:hypothetical protein [Nostoc sp. UHCC 0252]MEA5603688.1 hypothetical protein [Nostoc sp. UHCC 0252]
MKDEFTADQVKGMLLVVLVVIVSLKGCNTDPQYLAKYNYCMEGTPKPVQLLKALFQCAWV